MAREKKAPAGLPDWLGLFADLMSLLVVFFVLIISFSIQDQQKLQVVAGSMKDAFGIRQQQAKSGVIERQGNPQRDFLKQLAKDETSRETEYAEIEHNENTKQGQEANTFQNERVDVETENKFSLASATLKQAWKDLPEITHVSDNLIVQDTEEGLNIIIADQEGRSMFPEGSKYPYETTRQAIAAMAPILAKMPNQIRVTGHTAAGGTFTNPRYGKWELSADRANIVRSILQEFGIPEDKIFGVAGRGTSDPFFPNDPFLATNQRVSILLVSEEPPVPIDLAF